MIRLPAIFLAAASAVLSLQAADPPPASRRPNIVIFLADDQGWGDLSIHGNTNLSTPHIDSLAAQGAAFERFFVCPVCAPTRAEFLTGRFFSRTGVRGVSTGQERLNPDETTIADAFHAAGYATGAFGKWHNGSQHPYHPNARGFDEYYGFTSGHWGHYFDPILEHNGTIIRPEGFITDILTDKAMEFIDTNKEKPFFCYIPYCTPHSPMQVPDTFFRRFAEAPLLMHHREPRKEDPAHLRAALAMCENIDWNVGRVLKQLNDLQLAGNTIVVYFSDNGPNGHRWNGGMKGRKGSVDEGGVRVPCHIRWPGHINPGITIPQIAGAIDLLPTLTHLAGIPMTSAKPVDGRNITPLLTGCGGDWPDRMFITVQGGGGKGPRYSVRNQTFRLDNNGALHDLVQDPRQDHDIAPQHPKLVQELQAFADDYLAAVKPNLARDERPFTVGYAKSTPLPARDGVPHGEIKRSAGAPNCSFFTHWSKPGDAITWNIEVGAAGDYEAIVHYTCPAADVGATIELSFGDAHTSAQVTDAHDPPLRGAESDRSPRGSESYVKDFKPLSLGTIHLDRTTGLLTLRATDIPGATVADIRLLCLVRK